MSGLSVSLVMKFVSGMFVDLPSPVGLSYMWNFGSLLGVYLVVQIMTGFFYQCIFWGVTIFFDSVVHLTRDVGGGWLMRVFHANGASCFFMLMYFHMGWGLYYGSYRFSETWLSGVSIFLLAMQKRHF